MIDFSKWILWEERGDFELKHYPGIYMISITDKNLHGLKVDYKDVVYIGMTNSRKGLCGRWKQLDNTIKGKEGHNGGRTIRSKLGPYDDWNKKLFVCAKAVACEVKRNKRTPEDLRIMGKIACLEYEALAEFKEITGTEPEYNKQ
ncbi:hypothetical protein FTO70_15935 [Methanosarcina sp. KYL-1]|uniref:hypothetical protein n=1 Tax=Methanosarcina sp. KYL-1 TaxID=2602068 RepID=UPI002100922F|nr:hypothetical protein [Methanosarcina sp. KYL-1]MCQ1537137.1 hypothetical protein [Methanosarcina sp. KYL-1]